MKKIVSIVIVLAMTLTGSVTGPALAADVAQASEPTEKFTMQMVRVGNVTVRTGLNNKGQQDYWLGTQLPQFCSVYRDSDTGTWELYSAAFPERRATHAWSITTEHPEGQAVKVSGLNRDRMQEVRDSESGQVLYEIPVVSRNLLQNKEPGLLHSDDDIQTALDNWNTWWQGAFRRHMARVIQTEKYNQIHNYSCHTNIGVQVQKATLWTDGKISAAADIQDHIVNLKNLTPYNSMVNPLTVRNSTTDPVARFDPCRGVSYLRNIYPELSEKDFRSVYLQRSNGDLPIRYLDGAEIYNPSLPGCVQKKELWDTLCLRYWNNYVEGARKYFRGKNRVLPDSLSYPGPAREFVAGGLDQDGVWVVGSGYQTSGLANPETGGLGSCWPSDVDVYSLSTPAPTPIPGLPSQTPGTSAGTGSSTNPPASGQNLNTKKPVKVSVTSKPVYKKNKRKKITQRRLKTTLKEPRLNASVTYRVQQKRKGKWVSVRTVTVKIKNGVGTATSGLLPKKTKQLYRVCIVKSKYVVATCSSTVQVR